MILEQNGMVLIQGGCSCGCRFCTRSEGRIGAVLERLDADALPTARRVTIMAGDLLTDRIAPLIAALHEKGCQEVLVYAHPACGDVTHLPTLVQAGLTGIHLLLPAADRTTLEQVCGPAASLANASLVIRAANSLGLDIFFEIPVLRDNFQLLPNTVQRALGMAQRPVGVSLPFRALHASGGSAPWDFRCAAPYVDAAIRIAASAGIPVTLGGFEGPAPCVFNPTDARVEWYPELDRSRAGIASRTGKIAEICGACVVRPACFPGMQAFSGGDEPVTPVARPTDPASAETRQTGPRAAEFFIRRTDLDELLGMAAGLDRCPAPWDSLEMHDRTGRVAPCEGSWPRREILGTPDGKPGTGWLADGILKSFNSPPMVAMRAAMTGGGRAAACNSHCPRFEETAADRHDVRLPRTGEFHRNLLLNLREFIEGRAILESRPLNITISPSLRCNQRCRMCDLTDDDAGATGFDTPPEILDELETMLPTIATLALTGGEPLTSRRIVDLVSRITPLTFPDTRVTMTTNGTLLVPDVIERLRGSNLAAVFISLNAATARGHELVTGIPGRFDRVLSNVAAMVKAAPTMPQNPSVVLSFVVMRSTIDELDDFIALARRMGTGFRLLPIERNRFGESIFVDRGDLARAEIVVRSLRDRYMREWMMAVPEIERLHRVIRMKLADGNGSPL